MADLPDWAGEDDIPVEYIKRDGTPYPSYLRPVRRGLDDGSKSVGSEHIHGQNGPQDIQPLQTENPSIPVKAPIANEYDQLMTDVAGNYSINPSFVSHNQSGGDKMDADDILKSFIEQNSHDQAQLRQDVRESERRIAENTRNSEERIVGLIRDSAKQNADNIIRIEQRMDERIDKIEASSAQTQKHIQTMTVSTVLSVVGIALAIIGLIITFIASGGAKP